MKKEYQSPTLKVVEFKVERGFQASGFQGNTSTADPNIMNFEMEFDANGPRNEAYDFDNGTTFWN